MKVLERLASLLVLLATVSAHTELFPYGTSEGDQAAPRKLDGCDLRFDFTLDVFEREISTAYVCTNGIICFGSYTLRYRPIPFPIHHGMAIISPYFSDVDLRRGGNVWARVSTDAQLLNSASAMVRSYSGESFEGVEALVATWDSVHHWSNGTFTHLENTFQAVVITDNMRAFALYLYNDMQWPSGVLRYVHALIGFDDGTGVDYYNHPQSLTPSILDATRGSNVGQAGHWMFKLTYGLDECSLGIANCHQEATCTDTDESYICACNPGYTGDGFYCSVKSCSSEGNTYAPVPYTNCAKFTQSLGQPDPPIHDCPNGTVFNIEPCVCDQLDSTNCLV